MPPGERPVFVVLSARSLGYARHCLQSLLKNALEPLSLTLITDSPADKAALVEALEMIAPDPRHRWAVHDQADADARAAEMFAHYPNIQQFRQGHPCWRKITDPPLFAAEGEMVILDPDVYFPNPFRFEATPATGLLLMWHPTNCLFPPFIVRRAFRLGIPMADKIDIGVGHINNPLDWEWLDWLIGRLGGRDLPSWSAHVEPIVWSALAMRIGGGYLDPRAWFCWHNTVAKRLRVRLLKESGLSILRGESLREVKCFHAGGMAKGWLVDAINAGMLDPVGPQEQPFPPIPYQEYTRARFERKQAARGVASALGIMRVVGRPG